MNTMKRKKFLENYVKNKNNMKKSTGKTVVSKVIQKSAHIDEYGLHADLDFGDGFNAFDEDFYASYMH